VCRPETTAELSRWAMIGGVGRWKYPAFAYHLLRLWVLQAVTRSKRCERQQGGEHANPFVQTPPGLTNGIASQKEIPIPAEAITRINYQVGFGALEMDFSDGELRHAVAIDVEEGVLSPKMVDNMLGCAFVTMDRYHDAIMRVAFGQVDPVVALAEMEADES